MKKTPDKSKLNSNNITIYPCETDVVIKGTGIKGMISQVFIRGTEVTYEVRYYIGRERMVNTLPEFEIITNFKKQKIGFKCQPLMKK